MELGCQLYDSDISEESIPRGYVQVAYLFDWETQSQSSGWYAIANRRDTMRKVIDCYSEVGLPGEARAIAAAVAAWDASNGDDDIVAAAYASGTSEYPVDLDRLEHLVCHFIDHADDLFYVQAG